MTPGRPDLLVGNNFCLRRLIYAFYTLYVRLGTPYIRLAGVYTPYHTVVHLVPTVLSTGVLVLPSSTHFGRCRTKGSGCHGGPRGRRWFLPLTFLLADLPVTELL